MEIVDTRKKSKKYLKSDHEVQYKMIKYKNCEQIDNQTKWG